MSLWQFDRKSRTRNRYSATSAVLLLNYGGTLAEIPEDALDL
jgi:hypothetical protein